MTPNDDLTFEQAYAQLEDVVAQMEAGDLPLEDALQLYERGQHLARLCGEMLDAAELRIEQIDNEGARSPLD